MSRLVHAGSAVVDHVYRIDALPAPGTEKTATRYALMAGGGFNTMVAARRTGMRVGFAGRHGTGPNGDFLRAALAAEGIDTLTLQAGDGDNGNCVAMITDDAERTFVSWPGVEGVLSASDMAQVEIADGDWVVASGYTLSYPGSRDALADWLESLPAGIPLLFDPAPVVGEIPSPLLARVLARVTWLSCNVSEAAAIASAGDPEADARDLLRKQCPRAEGVVIRAGKEGALLRLRDGSSATVAGFEVTAVDTNGAGDTHIGAFVSALARGVPALEALRYANAAAAISVTRHGGAASPTDTEIRDFLALREKEAAAGGASIRLSA
jgi:sugar/nucleoside kinase (ribokinase family)